MKKRNLITCVVALVLVAALGIGATLAYLTDSDTAKNTFTTGNVKIDLVEPGWDDEKAQDLEPGDIIAKDPAVVNTGKNDAYMMIKVEGVNAMREQKFEVYFDAANWVLVDATGKAKDIEALKVKAEDSETNKDEVQLVDGYYVYNGTVKATEATTPLFTEVYYTTKAVGADFGEYLIKGMLNDDKNGVSHYEIWDAEGKNQIALTDKENKFASYDEAADYIVAEDGLNAAATTTYTFDLDVTGYGIQAQNITFEKDGVFAWVVTLLNP